MTSDAIPILQAMACLITVAVLWLAIRWELSK